MKKSVRKVVFSLIIIGLIISIAVFGYLLMSEKKINEGGVEMNSANSATRAKYSIVRETLVALTASFRVAFRSST